MTAQQILPGILTRALVAADPRAAVQRALSVRDGQVCVGGRAIEARRVVVLAVGKAGAGMAAAAVEVLGERIDGGLVVTRRGYDEAVPALRTLVAGHPEPDEGSRAAAIAVDALAAGLGEGDLLLALISGGASALLADVAGDITLDDLQSLSRGLLRSGASIGEINAVRKHLSTLKGGGLARRASPARVAVLLLSDVVGDDPTTIGSGLTVPDPTTLADALAVLRRHGLAAPPRIADYLAVAPETPKPGDPLFDGTVNVVVGSGRLSAEAAASVAREWGYAPLILSTSMTGAAAELGRMHAAIVREVLASGQPVPAPCALISGGEATVVVRGTGQGGPNQEFALAMALELEGVANWAALAADSDGIDGPTDAAGGLVDGTTAGRIRAQGLDPDAALAGNDTYGALDAAGALLRIGPTGTNVNDIRVVLIDGGT